MIRLVPTLLGLVVLLAAAAGTYVPKRPAKNYTMCGFLDVDADHSWYEYEVGEWHLDPQSDAIVWAWAWDTRIRPAIKPTSRVDNRIEPAGATPQVGLLIDRFLAPLTPGAVLVLGWAAILSVALRRRRRGSWASSS